MLTEGPVGRHLVSMTVPVLFGIATMMAQSLIDTWFIGRVGDAELAAFGFGGGSDGETPDNTPPTPSIVVSGSLLGSLFRLIGGG